MIVVVLSPALRRELVAAAAGALGGEACGVLIGSCSGDRVTIARVAATPNRAADPETFACDAGAVVALEAEARNAGLEIVGFWHGHASGDARPSSRDVSGAWPGVLTAIVCPARSPAVRFWSFEDGVAIEARSAAREACATALEAHNLRLEMP